MNDLPSFAIFRKSNKAEEPKMEENSEATPNQTTQTPEPPLTEINQVSEKAYLRAMPLRELSDLEIIKQEVKNGNIIILRITPLANKSVEDVKCAINELFSFTEEIGGDIARLGEERIVICPKEIRIWREKSPAQNEPLPTAA